MEDIRQKKSFLYSQSSLATFLACKKKFKYQYIDDIKWSGEDAELTEKFKKGEKFHTLAERYFTGIPTGEEFLEENELKKYFENLKETFLINKDYKYKAEYEIRIRNSNIKLMARYDLIIFKKDTVEIWDWKTGNKKLQERYQKDKLQTKIYLYLLKEILGGRVKSENISMNYWQPQYKNDWVTINYNEKMYNRTKKELTELMDNILKEENFEMTEYEKTCNYCEFEKICKTNNNIVK